MHQIRTAPPSWGRSHPSSSPGALVLGSCGGDSATRWPAPLPEDATRSAMSAAASRFLKNLSPEDTCFLSVINFSGETIIPIRIQTYLTTKPLKIVSFLFPSVSQLPPYISVPSSSKTPLQELFMLTVSGFFGCFCFFTSHWLSDSHRSACVPCTPLKWLLSGSSVSLAKIMVSSLPLSSSTSQWQRKRLSTRSVERFVL